MGILVCHYVEEDVLLAIAITILINHKSPKVETLGDFYKLS